MPALAERLAPNLDRRSPWGQVLDLAPDVSVHRPGRFTRRGASRVEGAPGIDFRNPAYSRPEARAAGGSGSSANPNRDLIDKVFKAFNCAWRLRGPGLSLGDLLHTPAVFELKADPDLVQNLCEAAIEYKQMVIADPEEAEPKLHSQEFLDCFGGIFLSLYGARAVLKGPDSPHCEKVGLADKFIKAAYPGFDYRLMTSNAQTATNVNVVKAQDAARKLEEKKQSKYIRRDEPNFESRFINTVLRLLEKYPPDNLPSLRGLERNPEMNSFTHIRSRIKRPLYKALCDYKRKHVPEEAPSSGSSSSEKHLAKAIMKNFVKRLSSRSADPYTASELSHLAIAFVARAFDHCDRFKTLQVLPYMTSQAKTVARGPLPVPVEEGSEPRRPAVSFEDRKGWARRLLSNLFYSAKIGASLGQLINNTADALGVRGCLIEEFAVQALCQTVLEFQAAYYTQESNLLDREDEDTLRRMKRIFLASIPQGISTAERESVLRVINHIHESFGEDG